MKLFRFPYLIQRNVMKQMGCGDLLLLSMGSKKSTKLIQSIGWGEVKEIEYKTVINKVTVSILDHQNNREEFLKISTDSGDQETQIIRISDKSLDCRFPSTVSSTLDFFFNVHEDEPSFKVIHDKIDALYGKNVKYVCNNEYKVDYTRPREYLEQIAEVAYPIGKIYFFPKNINFNKTIIDFDYGEFHLPELEEYFDAIPVQESVYLGMSLPSGHFHPRSRIFNIPNLIITKSDYLFTRDLFFNFNGRKASLFKLKEPNRLIPHVLKLWKSRQILRNLEELDIQSFPFDTNFQMIEGTFNVKRLPESIVPPKFKLNERKFIPMPSYIVRSDGIVAFCSITERLFVLSVTKFTEPEILENKCF